jgi:hypothetical protein
MRKIYVLLGLILILGAAELRAQSAADLVDICAANAGDDATYLKDFIVELAGASANEKPPQAKFSMVLSKNTRYRFSICNADNSQGRAIIQLFDENRLMGSTFNATTGKEYQRFDFNCTKTGVYHVFIFFQDGKPGSAVGILSFIEKL